MIALFLLGMAVAAAVGYITIAFLLRYLTSHNTYVFVWYRVILGIVVFMTFAR